MSKRSPEEKFLPFPGIENTDPLAETTIKEFPTPDAESEEIRRKAAGKKPKKDPNEYWKK